MTTRKPTTRLNLEPLETREVPTTLPTAGPAPTAANLYTRTTTTVAPVSPPGPDRFAVGYRTGGGAFGDVRVFQDSAHLLKEFRAYDLTVGANRTLHVDRISVVMADVTGDGVPDVITATDRVRDLNGGAATTPPVKVFDGATLGQPAPTVVRLLAPFGAAFTGGYAVAAGDFTGDGKADVAVSQSDAGAGRVRVFSGADLIDPFVWAPTAVAAFDGIGDPNGGGAVLAAGDVSGDRVPDLVAGAGAGPRVAVWDGTSLRAGQTPRRLVGDFFAFDPFPVTQELTNSTVSVRSAA